jgi:diguanylate cyclase
MSDTQHQVNSVEPDVVSLFQVAQQVIDQWVRTEQVVRERDHQLAVMREQTIALSRVDERRVLRRAQVAEVTTTIANLSERELRSQLDHLVELFRTILDADRCVVSTAANGADQTVLDLFADSACVDERHECFVTFLDTFGSDSDKQTNSVSIFLPLRMNGVIAGLIALSRCDGPAFEAEVVLQARLVAEVLAGALMRCEAVDKLTYQAATDALTGLGNRRRLTFAIEQAASDATRCGGVGLIFCKADNFKLVNESIGYDAGDEYLRELANRMVGASRLVDTITRFGGDQFAIVLDGVDGIRSVHDYTRKLRRSLVPSITINGTMLWPSVSFGIAFEEREVLSANPMSLVTHGNLAVREAKRIGQGAIVAFDPSLVRPVVDRLGIENELNLGIWRNELILHYQRIVDLADTTKTASLEGLVRWNHPIRGLVFPDDFIPVADRSHAISRITSMVMATGLAKLRSLRDSGFATKDLSFSFNAAVRDLRTGDLPGRVERALEYSGIEPSALHIEVTESSAIDDRTVFDSLFALRDLGVHIAIDDFGTGYASLSYLRDIPASSVKIDRSFVERIGSPRDRSLIAAAIAMTHELGMIAVAEGIETIEQEDALRSMGCDLGQGYLYGQPSENPFR